MIYLLLAIIVIAILSGPQIWVQRIIQRHNQPSATIKGTGGQFAQHLIDRLGLSESVKVEVTDQPNHYDPNDKAVRLNHEQFERNSLSAIAIAAHEVGHAIQDQEDFHWMRKQQRMAVIAHGVGKVAPVALAVAPIMLALTRSPAISGLTLLIGIGAMAIGVIVQLMTLPVETDASFNKALPILQQGEYLGSEHEYREARKILQAAAYTYLAAALYQMLNFAYWLRLLRR